MAFDAATGKMLLFGGHVRSVNGPFPFSAPMNDTWSWDGKQWSALPATTGLVARTQASMAYDATRHVIVMQGGFLADGAFVNETWTWNGTSWSLTNPGETPPAGGGRQPTTWDGPNGVVILFDDTARSAYWNLAAAGTELNQTWSWNGTSWKRLQVTGTPSGHGSTPASIAYDSARRSTVFFGHVNGVPTTWTFDGSTWIQASTAGPASLDFALAPDDANQVVVLFGEHGDTWTWDGTAWTAKNPPHSPSPRQQEAMAYDSARHVVVLFGGATTDSTGRDVQLNDTWTWNGSDWTRVG